MKKYLVPTLGLVFAITTLVSIGCSSTKAKNASGDQSSTGSSQSSQSTTGTSQSSTDQTAASTAGSDTLEGCVFKRQTELYLEPANGGAATKISSSGKDVSSNVGQNVRLSGSAQSSSQGGSQTSSTGTSGGSMSGSSSGTSATGEPEFVVTRVDVVAKECPADVQSRIDQDKKTNK